MEDTTKEGTETAETSARDLNETVVQLEPKDDETEAIRLDSLEHIRASSLSKLGLVSSDNGLHTVKTPSRRPRVATVDSIFEETDDKSKPAKTPSQQDKRHKKKRLSTSSASRRERWQSSRQHVEERKLHFDRRMTQVRKMARRVSVQHHDGSRRRSTKGDVRRQTVGGVEREGYVRKRVLRKRHLSQEQPDLGECQELDVLGEDILDVSDDETTSASTQPRKVGFAITERLDEDDEVGSPKTEPEQSGTETAKAQSKDTPSLPGIPSSVFRELPDSD